MSGFIVKAGDLATLDAFLCGLVPVKVLAISLDGVATVRVTADRKAHRRGEVLRATKRDLVSRKQIHVRSGQYRIWGQTILVPDEVMSP